MRYFCNDSSYQLRNTRIHHPNHDILGSFCIFPDRRALPDWLSSRLLALTLDKGTGSLTPHYVTCVHATITGHISVINKRKARMIFSSLFSSNVSKSLDFVFDLFLSLFVSDDFPRSRAWHRTLPDSAPSYLLIQ